MIDEVSAALIRCRQDRLLDGGVGFQEFSFDNLQYPLRMAQNKKWLRVSSHIFQERPNSILQEVKGISTCVDDVLARGVDSKDHDVNVLRLLDTARMNGIKFTPKKLQFKSTKCKLFVHTLMRVSMGYSRTCHEINK